MCPCTRGPGVAGRRPRLPGIVEVDPLGGPAREVLDPVLALVGRDAQQPGRELRLAPEAVDGLEHDDEDLLRDVLGLVAVAEHPVDEAEDLVSVETDDLGERLLVAFLEAGDEKPLGQAHRVGDPCPPHPCAGKTERRLHTDSDTAGAKKFPSAGVTGVVAASGRPGRTAAG